VASTKKAAPARWRRASALGAAVACAALVAACSSGGSSATGSGGSKPTFTLYDPYTFLNASSPWAKDLNKCFNQAGVLLKRSSYDNGQMPTQTLLAAQQGRSPNIVVIDPVVVSTLIAAGVLAPNDVTKINTSGVAPNFMQAGTVDGKVYGIPVGANTIALYYNKKILAAAKINPASITSWSALTAALQKVKKAGYGGITLSAVGTEEGSFQFMPWLWGSGGQTTNLASADDVAAMSLWTGWMKSGLTPNADLQTTQTDAWAPFAAGKYGFAENGPWEVQNAGQLPFKYGVILIPKRNGGGPASVPLGGEWVTIPVQKDTATYATSRKIVNCLTSPSQAYTADNALSYIGVRTAVQQRQQSTNPAYAIWVKAVNVAQSRNATPPGLGTNYPKISEQLWDAIQASLSGSKTPQGAMVAAQTAAAQATGGK